MLCKNCENLNKCEKCGAVIGDVKTDFQAKETYSITSLGLSGKQWFKKLKEDGVNIGTWAKEILFSTSFKPLKKGTTYEVVRLAVADLGFTKATRYDELCKKAKELGLELCPSEAGPALRLQLKDQPMGDWFVVAMKPLADSDGGPELFRVHRHVVGRWLGADDGSPGGRWSPGNSFVVVRGKY